MRYRMKAVSKSVSMPDQLWDIVEVHAPTTPGKDRSGYIRNLVEQDLAQSGKLPGTVHAEIIAAADEVGHDRALEILRKAGRRKAAA